MTIIVVMAIGVSLLFLFSLCAAGGRADERMERIMATDKRRNQNETDPVLAEIPEIEKETIVAGGIHGGAAGFKWLPDTSQTGRLKDLHAEEERQSLSVPGSREARRRRVSAERKAFMFPVLIVAALAMGMVAGWNVRVHSAEDQYLSRMAAKYQAQQVWLDAQTTAMLADVERDIAAVKSEFKKKSKEVKRHGK